MAIQNWRAGAGIRPQRVRPRQQDPFENHPMRIPEDVWGGGDGIKSKIEGTIEKIGAMAGDDGGRGLTQSVYDLSSKGARHQAKVSE